MFSSPVQCEWGHYRLVYPMGRQGRGNRPRLTGRQGDSRGYLMAKKRILKGTAKGLTGQPPTSSFDETFPAIARWISQEEGWVELGADHYSRSVVRALYGGGMAWEGTDEYGSLDEALRAMEEGIAAWLDENRPAGLSRKGARKKGTRGPIVL